MKSGDDYTDFVHTFVCLTGQSRKHAAEWKSEFKRKILPSISDKLVVLRASSAHLDIVHLGAVCIGRFENMTERLRAAHQSVAGLWTPPRRDG